MKTLKTIGKVFGWIFVVYAVFQNICIAWFFREAEKAHYISTENTTNQFFGGYYQYLADLFK